MLQEHAFDEDGVAVMSSGQGHPMKTENDGAVIIFYLCHVIPSYRFVQTILHVLLTFIFIYLYMCSRVNMV